jgi:protein involved in polysaccharide export with SLBB domain
MSVRGNRVWVQTFVAALGLACALGLGGAISPAKAEQPWTVKSDGQALGLPANWGGGQVTLATGVESSRSSFTIESAAPSRSQASPVAALTDLRGRAQSPEASRLVADPGVQATRISAPVAAPIWVQPAARAPSGVAAALAEMNAVIAPALATRSVAPIVEVRARPTVSRQALKPVATASAVVAAGQVAAAPIAGDPRDKADVYVLGPSDRVKLIVFQEPELSGEFVVQSTGRVALPLIGEVQAQGLSVRDFENAISNELRARQFLNDPKVAVEVLSARPFYILGEVTKPGEYPYQAGLSVLNAVATAGGFSPLADQTAVYIKRAGTDNWVRFSLEGGLSVGPGDTVRVEKGAFYILGEVQKAGEYPFTPGMTVLRAVATAQGFTPRAERGRVLITRRGETQQREVPMRPDATINPGDTIIILERWF